MKSANILFCLFFTILSCAFFDGGSCLNRQDLVGRFVYQENLRDTIDVGSDGTYSNYTWWNGRKLQNEGTWVYDSLAGRVFFQDFSLLTDTLNVGDSTFLPRGIWDAEIEIKNDDIRFIYASDIDKGYFLRVDDVDRRRYPVREPNSPQNTLHALDFDFKGRRSNLIIKVEGWSFYCKARSIFKRWRLLGRLRVQISVS